MLVISLTLNLLTEVYYKEYEIPVWADSVIKCLRLNNIDITHLKKAGTRDIEFIAMILRRIELTF